MLNKIQWVFVYEFKGIWYDVGYKFGYLKMMIEYGLIYLDVKVDLWIYIKDFGVKLFKEDSVVFKIMKKLIK